MPPITNDWQQPLEVEFKKPYYKDLYKKVLEEYRSRQIFPNPDDIFNAFHLTPLKDVKVVILGQDPYHNDGQAHGLCFSVKPDVEVPPSLVNIYKELQDDLGCRIPNNGYLVKWAKQGVLMLNTVLTVRAHQANSHRGIGWEQFTDAVIRAVDAQDRPIVFLFWRHRIRVRCLRTVGFSAVSISARPMHFWRKTDLRRSTGRLKMCDLAGIGQKHHYGLCIYLVSSRM